MVKALVIDQNNESITEVNITLPSKELNKPAHKVIKNSLVKNFFSNMPTKKTIKGFMFIELDDDTNIMIFGYSNINGKNKVNINKFNFNEFIGVDLYYDALIVKINNKENLLSLTEHELNQYIENCDPDSGSINDTANGEDSDDSGENMIDDEEIESDCDEPNIKTVTNGDNSDDEENTMIDLNNIEDDGEEDDEDEELNNVSDDEEIESDQDIDPDLDQEEPNDLDPP